jgi:DNA replication protein DnaC
MKATTKMVLTENLKALNLSHMLRQLEPQLRQAREQSLDYGDLLLSLTETELEGRAENRLKRRLREAKFPLLKTLETFDYHAAPGLERRLLHQLASGEYINQRRNVIFLGKSGTGKTHLATGLGVEACRQGITTRFVTGCGLANELLEARQGHTLGRLIQRYSSSWMNWDTSPSPRKEPSYFSRSWRSGTNGGRSLSPPTWALPTGPRSSASPPSPRRCWIA